LDDRRSFDQALIPIIGVGYGLAYMERIGVSFAALLVAALAAGGILYELAHSLKNQAVRTLQSGSTIHVPFPTLFKVAFS
jgi:hypothetical protein